MPERHHEGRGEGSGTDTAEGIESIPRTALASKRMSKRPAYRWGIGRRRQERANDRCGAPICTHRISTGISLNGERPRRQLLGSCGHDADASGRHRGGDGGARRRRQRLLVARQRPRARRVVEESRESLAAALGARPSEVLFTGGGTESDNLAVKGLYWARRAADPRRRRVLVSAIEHHAVLDAADWLAAEQGADVVWLP